MNNSKRFLAILLSAVFVCSFVPFVSAGPVSNVSEEEASYEDDHYTVPVPAYMKFDLVVRFEKDPTCGSTMAYWNQPAAFYDVTHLLGIDFNTVENYGNYTRLTKNYQCVYSPTITVSTTVYMKRQLEKIPGVESVYGVNSDLSMNFDIEMQLELAAANEDEPVVGVLRYSTPEDKPAEIPDGFETVEGVIAFESAEDAARGMVVRGTKSAYEKLDRSLYRPQRVSVLGRPVRGIAPDILYPYTEELSAYMFDADPEKAVDLTVKFGYETDARGKFDLRSENPHDYDILIGSVRLNGVSADGTVFYVTATPLELLRMCGESSGIIEIDLFKGTDEPILALPFDPDAEEPETVILEAREPDGKPETTEPVPDESVAEGTGEYIIRFEKDPTCSSPAAFQNRPAAFYDVRHILNTTFYSTLNYSEDSIAYQCVYSPSLVAKCTKAVSELIKDLEGVENVAELKNGYGAVFDRLMQLELAAANDDEPIRAVLMYSSPEEKPETVPDGFELLEGVLAFASIEDSEKGYAVSGSKAAYERLAESPDAPVRISPVARESFSVSPLEIFPYTDELSLYMEDADPGRPISASISYGTPGGGILDLRNSDPASYDMLLMYVRPNGVSPDGKTFYVTATPDELRSLCANYSTIREIDLYRCGDEPLFAIPFDPDAEEPLTVVVDPIPLETPSIPEHTEDLPAVSETGPTELPDKTCIPGDVDGDGAVTADDARETLRYSLELENAVISPDTGDVDSDGELTAADARLILRTALGLS
ncbi:MAG: dockerin type I repeat-containing protein [Clostridia bacterium]|nr:dockerin type I repeat-containing protein [Clostridia bacterium]